MACFEGFPRVLCRSNFGYFAGLFRVLYRQMYGYFG